MNMVDTKKVHRGVLLWREDILKCSKVARKPISETIRDIFHREMGKYSLDDVGKGILRNQIQNAIEARKRNHPRAGSRRPKTLVYEQIVVAGKPKFVKGK